MVDDSPPFRSPNMPPSRRGPSALILLLGLVVALPIGCGGPSTPATTASAPGKGGPDDEIPADQLAPVLEANLVGRGLMEQFKYGEAADSFREVHRLAPGWIPGSINLAIALLNDTGLKIEKAKAKGEELPPSNFDQAL